MGTPALQPSWTEAWVTWEPTTCDWCLRLGGSLVALSP